MKAEHVLITGAASGIGRACAEEFHAGGYPVIGWDLRAGGDSRFSWEELDVSDWDSLEAAGRDLPPLHCVVACAALGVRGPVLEADPGMWRKVLGVNVEGTAYTAMATFEGLRAASGTLVTMASIAASSVFRYRAHYSASKAAVVMLTKSLANEWAQYGIRTVCVSPGFTMTPMLEESLRSGLTDELVIMEHTPQRAFVEPENVAKCVRAVASPDFARVTGSEILVDAGWSALTGF